jgi:phosphatidylserine decarboxylase
MKYSGKARKAAFKLILLSAIAVVVVWAVGTFTVAAAAAIAAFAIAITPVLLVLWILFSIFTLFFFRDPEAKVPEGTNVVLSPAHGKVDVIDTITERDVMGGECQRISMFLSVMNVHVQNAPVSGKLTLLKYTMGQFMNAIRSECADCNENVLLGFEATTPAGVKIGLRLVAGVIARRIVPFVKEGEEVVRGQRISLIQFGSRAEVYLPMRAKIQVKLGDNVVGGETIFATID